MSLHEKDYLKASRRKRALNVSGTFYDTINFILGIAIIVCSLILFIEYRKYAYLFAVDFLLAATMNLVMGIKYYKRSEMVKTTALILASIFLYVMCVIGFIALW